MKDADGKVIGQFWGVRDNRNQDMVYTGKTEAFARERVAGLEELEAAQEASKARWERKHPAYCCTCRRGLTPAEWAVEKPKTGHAPPQCPECRAAGKPNPGYEHRDRVERDNFTPAY